MKYCPRCKNVYFTENDKCKCGKRFKRDYDMNDPVELIVWENDNHDVENCLIDAEIPYSLRSGVGVLSNGTDITGKLSYLVPMCFLKKGINELSEAGLMKKPEWYSKLDMPDEPKWDEMPKGKQTAVRILSFAAFLIIVYICVALVDVIAQRIFGVI